LKEYSEWPTFPQVYMGGELVGGLDIVCWPPRLRIARRALANRETAQRGAGERRRLSQGLLGTEPEGRTCRA